ncbi:MFS general substrate transporter [Hygrophoropsis aurantiaca]|uniref:MFS general substrate transporter n=1 Tax=Hygrophoropsis aurantiaca TaxID=72124 RepID=A0ACB8A7K4_9AGAM|nr:MFS general substrate transporter [Hygrophoropsis aurantiaca]
MSSLAKDERSSADEKQIQASQLEDADISSATTPPYELNADEERKLWRKVDMRLMPIMSLMYLLSFLDRGNIGNAKLEGITTQLNLTGNKYNIALTMFFIPYCIFECPAKYISLCHPHLFWKFIYLFFVIQPCSESIQTIQWFAANRWLPGIMILWGLIMTLMGLVKTYPQLVGVRVCLGIAEAGLFPGVVYYLSLWYPRHMLQYRVGLFFGAATLAGAFSGLLAFGIGYMGGTKGLEGWSWIFILEGIATIVVAVAALFILVDFPDTAKFLTQEERAFIIWRKKYDNSSVGEEENFAPRHVWAAFADWQVWLHILVYMSIVAPLYGITLFLPTIIKDFGYDTPISQLLTVPPYVVATIVLLVFAHFSDKLKIRSPFILAGLVMCLIGFAINISNAPSGVKYFGTFFCVAGSYAAFPGIVCWLGNNLAGQYKRGVGMALHIGIGNLSGAIASNIYRTQDSPRFILGHGLELMFVGIGFITLPIVLLLYKRINHQRDEVERLAHERGEKLQYSAQELRELGDRAPDFRYTY